MEKALRKLYGDDTEELNRQKARYTSLIKKHQKHFGENKFLLFSAPGRTEIIGNHTDHNNGKVIAASVNLDSIAAVSRNDKNVVTVFSEGYEKPFFVDLDVLEPYEKERGRTNALIRGIAAGFRNAGYEIGGFNATITSQVLAGSGLSSSASVEILIATIFNHLYNGGGIGELEIAKIGRYAENEFFGKPCGLMDQLACAVGGIVAIDFYDPENPIIEKVEFDFDKYGYTLLIVDTNGNHEDLTDEYAAITEEMKNVARVLGKSVCREVTYEEIMENLGTLRQKAGDRAVLRALHFMEENQRVTRMLGAIKNEDIATVVSLMRESGNSSFKWLQNIYSVKNLSRQDIALSLALTEKFIDENGYGACRVHGGGFAGTIQVLLPTEFLPLYEETLNRVSKDYKIVRIKIRESGAVRVL